MRAFGRRLAAREGGGALFGSLIVCYLFLGGAGAGACLVSAALSLLSPASLTVQRMPGRTGSPCRIVRLPEAYRRLLAPGLAAGLTALGAGMVCLLADVGRIDRVASLLLNPSLSYVAAGAWALAACFLLACFLLVAWVGLARLSVAVVRVAEVLLALASVVTMAYTGLLLQSMPSVPLWSTPWLPVLFVFSSLSCGCAMVLAVGQFSGAARMFGGVFRRLAAVDAVVVACEILVAAAYVAAVSGLTALGAPAFSGSSGTGQALAASSQVLVGGPDAWLFWVVFAAGGLAFPLAADLAIVRVAKPLPMMALAVAAGVLAGGLALRYCLVEAGMQPILQMGL